MMMNDVRACLRVALVDGTRALVIAGLAGLAFAVVVLLVLRFVDPPASSLMVQQSLAGRAIDQRWQPLDAMSPQLIRAVVNSEDARFCSHWGVDRVEFNNALATARDEGGLAVRGASTISMQVVKNLFLWPDQSYFRKGLELAVTPLMEFIWPKRRILEVYLNIVEWGPGIFGAEAAARRHFKTSAAKVSRAQAALMAAALPNPIVRKVGRPGPRLRRRARQVRGRVRRSRTDLSCIGAKS
ncbi:MAG: monofunctional biosynthetic peptidoglycan transglycosylase [Pseudomonadota bacterium]